jgi:hypothetical protein
MSVHHEITAHSAKQAERILGYKKLDAQREFYIEEAVTKCLNGESFEVENINWVTEELNRYAKIHHLPERKYVTKEMIQEYCDKIK